MSRPPSTGRRKCAWSECSRLFGGASLHAALIVRASPTPPKTTGPHPSGVRPTQLPPCRSCRSRSRNSSTASCCCVARSVTSAPPELRGALLEDGSHRLLSVFAVQAGDGGADLLDRSGVDIGDERCSRDEMFCAAHGEGRLRGDRLAELQQPCLELLGGHDFGHEPETQRLAGIDEARLEQEAQRGLVPDESR